MANPAMRLLALAILSLAADVFAVEARADDGDEPVGEGVSVRVSFREISWRVSWAGEVIFGLESPRGREKVRACFSDLIPPRNPSRLLSLIPRRG